MVRYLGSMLCCFWEANLIWTQAGVLIRLGRDSCNVPEIVGLHIFFIELLRFRWIINDLLLILIFEDEFLAESENSQFRFPASGCKTFIEYPQFLIFLHFKVFYKYSQDRVGRSRELHPDWAS